MKKKLINIMFVALVILLARGISFAEVTISATVDKNEITMEDSVFLVVTVEGVRSADPAPVVSGGGAFDVISRGTSSSVSIINGDYSSSVEFSFVLTPKKVGRFQLPAVTYKDSRRILRADPLTIVVKEVSAEIENRDSFAESEVSKLSLYVNEQILFTYRFSSVSQITRASYEPPVFNNFISQQLGDTSTFNKIIDGKRYTVNEIKYALFPVQSGELTIPPVKLSAEVVVGRVGRFGGYADTKVKQFETKPITLNVKPRPPYNNKDVPFSNLIGIFSMDVSFGAEKLSVGGSTTLTVTVHGYGDIKNFKFPEIAGMQDFKTYDDKPVEDVKVTKSGIYGTKTFKKAFIPLKAGKLVLPSIKFAYFNTEKNNYEILSTNERVLDVAPATEQEKLNLVEMVGRTTTKEAVKIIGRDVLPINTSLNSLKDEEFNLLAVQNISVALLPGIIYFALLIMARRKESYSIDENKLKRKRALKEFTKSAGDLNKLIVNDSKSFYSGLLNAFKKYIGDKFNIVGSALTSKELKDILLRESVHKEVVTSVTEAIEKLERAQFASADFSADDKRELLKTLISAVKKIEKRAGK